MTILLLGLLIGARAEYGSSAAIDNATNTVATIDISKETVTQLSQRVRMRTDKDPTRSYYSERAMELLLKQWDPVGKPAGDLVKMLGPADKTLIRATDNQEWLVYKFAGGMVRWSFEISEGKVLNSIHAISD